MKLMLAFKMKAMKGLFESFFFCFPLPTLRGILNIPNVFLGKSSVTIIYCLFLFIYVRDIITTMFHITEFIDTYFYLGVYPTRGCPREGGN